MPVIRRRDMLKGTIPGLVGLASGTWAFSTWAPDGKKMGISQRTMLTGALVGMAGIEVGGSDVRLLFGRERAMSQMTRQMFWSANRLYYHPKTPEFEPFSQRNAQEPLRRSSCLFSCCGQIVKRLNSVLEQFPKHLGFDATHAPWKASVLQQFFGHEKWDAARPAVIVLKKNYITSLGELQATRMELDEFHYPPDLRSWSEQKNYELTLRFSVAKEEPGVMVRASELDPMMPDQAKAKWVALVRKERERWFRPGLPEFKTSLALVDPDDTAVYGSGYFRIFGGLITKDVTGKATAINMHVMSLYRVKSDGGIDDPVVHQLNVAFHPKTGRVMDVVSLNRDCNQMLELEPEVRVCPIRGVRRPCDNGTPVALPWGRGG
jgi:hypothetical protein